MNIINIILALTFSAAPPVETNYLVKYHWAILITNGQVVEGKNVYLLYKTQETDIDKAKKKFLESINKKSLVDFKSHLPKFTIPLNETLICIPYVLDIKKIENEALDLFLESKFEIQR